MALDTVLIEQRDLEAQVTEEGTEKPTTPGGYEAEIIEMGEEEPKQENENDAPTPPEPRNKGVVEASLQPSLGQENNVSSSSPSNQESRLLDNAKAWMLDDTFACLWLLWLLVSPIIPYSDLFLFLYFALFLVVTVCSFITVMLSFIWGFARLFRNFGYSIQYRLFAVAYTAYLTFLIPKQGHALKEVFVDGPVDLFQTISENAGKWLGGGGKMESFILSPIEGQITLAIALVVALYLVMVKNRKYFLNSIKYYWRFQQKAERLLILTAGDWSAFLWFVPWTIFACYPETFLLICMLPIATILFFFYFGGGAFMLVTMLLVPVVRFQSLFLEQQQHETVEEDNWHPEQQTIGNSSTSCRGYSRPNFVNIVKFMLFSMVYGISFYGLYVQEDSIIVAFMNTTKDSFSIERLLRVFITYILCMSFLVLVGLIIRGATAVGRRFANIPVRPDTIRDM